MGTDSRASSRGRAAKKGPFAGPLRSPLTDSNRRPPPYHGGSQAVLAGMAGHSRLFISRFLLQIGSLGVCLRCPRVPARAQPDVPSRTRGFVVCSRNRERNHGCDGPPAGSAERRSRDSPQNAALCLTQTLTRRRRPCYPDSRTTAASTPSRAPARAGASSLANVAALGGSERLLECTLGGQLAGALVRGGERGRVSLR